MGYAALLLGPLMLLAVILLALLIERRHPLQQQPSGASRFNLAYMLIYAASGAMLAPLTAIVTVQLVNAAGGGLINLASSGWMLAPAFLAYALTMDFLEYVFHRVQHRVPAMWAMHSFHHSDTAMNASTTTRHYWAEAGIKALSIYLLAGILFKTNMVILGMYGILSLYHVFPHMNVRVGFGRYWMLCNSPQYHRVHHSVQAEHFNCNFAGLFPVFDWLFGTHHIPRAGEYPPTGLDTGKAPGTLLDALTWPVRSKAPSIP
ncbi:MULTISPECIES: sterol desaturase family protein [unclassified Janthinobacterium]|uniref:sterol desaturase family protein n=1 Tax=unclassified Janthinobacterium TaxID=2610881 RepID=UPI0025B5C7B6|nr:MULTISPECIES: sterol desaturase family protein [unclassified Janthinobacterium]MDN2679231.1 sterol desaturase family protein [Janthinobacterium sp. SUN033]MDN2717627.1 sterol desaturase family protein [Janthinobacterium sp. SUN120]MDO8049101.1 sterol desaturase family protein [Janthinobacterium sp. SUN211]MDO8067724.1 sterol desaturase family protein [Janthinobacterium sp. SUN206]MDO8073754.1 sterol desaturase family protein [Janthinobacterium sp. SUN176]